jgi:hypothetical protein
MMITGKKYLNSQRKVLLNREKILGTFSATYHKLSCFLFFPIKLSTSTPTLFEREKDRDRDREGGGK